MKAGVLRRQRVADRVGQIDQPSPRPRYGRLADECDEGGIRAGRVLARELDLVRVPGRMLGRPARLAENLLRPDRSFLSMWSALVASTRWMRERRALGAPVRPPRCHRGAVRANAATTGGCATAARNGADAFEIARRCPRQTGLERRRRPGARAARRFPPSHAAAAQCPVIAHRRATSYRESGSCGTRTLPPSRASGDAPVMWRGRCVRQSLARVRVIPPSGG